MPEVILPGVYVTVKDEGLISAGAVSSGNIGMVGTSSKGPVNQVVILGSFSEAKDIFGESDSWQGGDKNELTLVRALELVFNNGGKTVYAIRAASEDVAVATTHLKVEGEDVITIEAKTPGDWGNSITVSVMSGEKPTDPKVITIASGLTQETYVAQKVEELAEQIDDGSELVRAKILKAGATISNAENLELSGGHNGAATSADDYKTGLEKLENDIVNIVVLAGQDISASSLLEAHLNITEGIKRERIGLIGAASDEVSEVGAHALSNDRLIYVAPGISATVVDIQTRKQNKVQLPAAYTAAAVAGLISSIPVQTSPTNKVLTMEGLNTEYNAPSLEKLVQSRVLAVEKRAGYRVVKGITTDTNSAWHQITTRRIVDYAIYGVRSGCNPYIGKLNNDRVRSAMKATLDAFLTRMVNSEALVGYTLEVSATRAQQIAGEVQVIMTLQPTFSIDFIKVTMYLS